MTDRLQADIQRLQDMQSLFVPDARLSLVMLRKPGEGAG